MLSKVCSAAVNGIDAYPVEVEVNAGYEDTLIMKAEWRILGAVLFLGFMFLGRGPGVALAQEALIVETNLIYGTAVDYTGSNVVLMLDAYYTAGSQTNRPVMILTHGGGFGGGDKGYTSAQGNFYPDMATAFATNGFVAFSLNYRLWPGCPGDCAEEIDMAVADVITALGWIQRQSAHYGIDATRVLIGGDSAGGGLAVNTSYRSTNLNSFLGCLSLWGGVPPYGTNVQPVNMCPITSQTPPTCMVHGTADTIVPYAVSVMLASNLTAAGVYNELHPLAGDNHYPVMVNNVYQTNLVAAIIQYMIAFANLETGNGPPAGPVAGGVRLGGLGMQLAPSQFSFDIAGPTNVVIAMERSTNLMSTWEPIATNPLPTGAAWFTDTVSAASQFYRARMVPP
jgi:acetyl esterase/lipase